MPSTPIRIRPLLSRTACALALSALGAPALADTAPFELTGPDLRIMVTRGERTLPIARVPSLAPGDKVVVERPTGPDDGARFLLVSAFLRGAASPPPKNWLASAETWKDKDRQLTLTVPKGARQMVVLLVPRTGGAEGVLVDAVRGKPGEFVRAGQDLNQASLDHSRLQAFMAAIQAQGDSGPEALRTVAPMLARSLSIKLQEDCLSKVIEQQASCLVQNKDALVLGDVHTSSLADTLTGTPTDLALQLSATREAGAGYYSAYIGVVRDIARIFGAFNNPQFTYLPTLTVRNDDTVALLLNAAPSFEKPKSVMVVALPAIEADIPPQLRSTAKGPICAAKAGAVLPVEGAPLIYSTQFAHAMNARLTAASGQVLEVPVTPRADKGGYVLGTDALPAAFTGTIRAHLHGEWGFVPFDGPDFELERPGPQGWKAAGDPALVVGRDNEVALEGAAPSCVGAVTLRQANGTKALVARPQGGRLLVTVPLDAAAAGDLALEVRQAGISEPWVVPLKARVQASRLDALELHAGDASAVLTGQRLDQVRSVSVAGMEFQPGGLRREGTLDRLELLARGDAHAGAPGTAARAVVTLHDGRQVGLAVRIAAPRPQARLLGRTVYPAPAAGTLSFDLDGGDLLPDNAEMVFSLKAASTTTFGAQDVVEIAGSGNEPIARLSAGRGLTLESGEVAVATLMAADLPPATWGALRFRVVAGQAAAAGDWQPLATLVRLPRVDAVSCDKPAEQAGAAAEARAAKDACSLIGRNLFLIGAVSAQRSFAAASVVEPGFTGGMLSVPRPGDGTLYLQLRDAPDRVVALRTR